MTCWHICQQTKHSRLYITHRIQKTTNVKEHSQEHKKSPTYWSRAQKYTTAIARAKNRAEYINVFKGPAQNANFCQDIDRCFFCTVLLWPNIIGDLTFLFLSFANRKNHHA